MARRVILASVLLAGSTAACISPIRDFHGYSADDVQPTAIQPGTDTRASVLAQLGSPSTESIFDQNTWLYISTARERFAYMVPKTKQRTITAIRFDENDAVAEVLDYDETSGEVINYVSRETATRGRELGLLEQIFGTVGAGGLLRTDESTPSDPLGR